MAFTPFFNLDSDDYRSTHPNIIAGFIQDCLGDLNNDADFDDHASLVELKNLLDSAVHYDNYFVSADW